MQKTQTPLYKMIADVLKGRITSGEYATGSQLPIEIELAKSLNTTRQTLRRALELVEAEGLIHRIRGKGTFVSDDADNISAHPLLFAGSHFGHLYQDLYLTFTAEVEKRQHLVIPFALQNEPGREEASYNLQQSLDRCSAIVALAETYRQFEDTFNTSALPLVQIHIFPPEGVLRPGYHIAMDRSRAMELAVNELIALGHRNIAYIGHAPDREADYEGNFPPPLIMESHTYRSYRAALHNMNLPEGPTYAFYCDDAEQSQALLRPFLEKIRGKATALVCEQDWRALQVMHTAKELGILIPDELSVIGMGNTPWSQSSQPQMTSVSLEEKEIARIAAILIEQPMPAEPVLIRVEPKLYTRGSTAKIIS
jgi:GntR family transcriptional regulator of arabinose operon